MKKVLRLFFKKENISYLYLSFFSFLILFFMYFLLLSDEIVYLIIPVFLFIFIYERFLKIIIIKLKRKNFKYYIYFLILFIFLIILYFVSIVILNYKINIDSFNNVIFVKSNFFIFLVLITTLLFYLLRYFFLFLKDNQILFLIFLIFISFLFFIIKKDILINVVFSSILIFLYYFYYFIQNNYPFHLNFKKNKNESIKILVQFFIIVLLILFSAYFSYQKSFSIRLNKASSLLKEENFKFNFKDNLDISTNYSFQNRLLFLIKTKNIGLLKTKVYSRYSYEKGFYSDRRELPFPEKLSDTFWEDINYIIGKEFRVEDEITIFNINLFKDVVFGKNEPYKIVPLIAENSIFTNIFKSISLILNENDKFEISFNKLSKLEYDRYTEIIINDADVKNFIEEIVKKNNLKTKEEIITFFYTFFKKNYAYSLSSKGEGFEIIKNFLIYERKGYCSHFAYSYAMILRYFGIPCRVVGGFKFNKKNLLFDDYYKIFDFNAHAWVEIWTDKYGWIEVDPTSDILASDEILPFSQEFKENEYKYLENILKIMDNLKEVNKKYEEKEEDKKENINKFKFEKYKKEFIKKAPLYFIILILLIIFSFFTKYFFLFIFLNNKFFSKRFAKILFKDLRKVLNSFIKRKLANSFEINKLITFEDISNFLRYENLIKLKHKNKNKYFIKNIDPNNMDINYEMKYKLKKKFDINKIKEDYYYLYFNRIKKNTISIKGFIQFIKIFYYFYFQSLLF